MDYINAYVQDVGRRLPARIRKDVEMELHSLILDALEEKYPQVEGDYTDEQQLALLKEYDSPAKMAAQYTSPHQYLVGPRLFPTFRIAALAVFGALLLSTLVAYFVEMKPWLGGGYDWLTLLTKLLEGVFASLLTGIGSVTLAFAILERVLPENVKISMQDEEWDPETLTLDEEEEKIQPVALILGVVFIAVGLVWLNFFPEKVGFFSYLSTDSFHGWVGVPALAPVFFSTFLPLLNVYWIFQAILNLVLLGTRKWNRVVRTLDFTNAVLGIVIVVRFMNGPAIFELGNAVNLTGETLEAFRIVVDILSTMWNIGLVFILFAAIFGAAKRLFRIFDIYLLDEMKRLVKMK
ncbi:MAG: hypothetical protein JXA25_16445 [Anaerolineales bacterium]|nr:hypothetical protein [Anaerolineales bacterium]